MGCKLWGLCVQVAGGRCAREHARGGGRLRQRRRAPGLQRWRPLGGSALHSGRQHCWQPRQTGKAPPLKKWVSLEVVGFGVWLPGPLSRGGVRGCRRLERQKQVCPNELRPSHRMGCKLWGLCVQVAGGRCAREHARGGGRLRQRRSAPGLQRWRPLGGGALQSGRQHCWQPRQTGKAPPLKKWVSLEVVGFGVWLPGPLSRGGVRGCRRLERQKQVCPNELRPSHRMGCKLWGLCVQVAGGCCAREHARGGGRLRQRRQLWGLQRWRPLGGSALHSGRQHCWQPRQTGKAPPLKKWVSLEVVGFGVWLPGPLSRGGVRGCRRLERQKQVCPNELRPSHRMGCKLWGLCVQVAGGCCAREHARGGGRLRQRRRFGACSAGGRWGAAHFNRAGSTASSLGKQVKHPPSKNGCLWRWSVSGCGCRARCRGGV